MGCLLYIDPGTGSMLFTILISIVSSLLFFWKKLVIKLKFMASGGRVTEEKDYLPYVIFSDSKRYWNVFYPICEEFEKRGIELEYMTASADDPCLTQKYEHVHCQFIGEGNKAFARLNLLNAGIVLSTTPGLEVYQWKRSKNVGWYAHIFHTVDEALCYRMFGMDYYDAILLTGEFQEQNIRKLEELRNLPAKETYVVGSTLMDILKDKLEKSNFKKDSVNVTVLLAPSWGESSILSRYGATILRELVKTGYKIIVRPHPQSMISEKEIIEPLMKAFPDSDSLQWNFDNDNFEVLQKADLMITDFSGIIFDFALVFGKPILYADTSFDPAPYDAAWVEGPLWRFEVLKDLGEPLTEEALPHLKETIDQLIGSSAKTQARDRVREEAWQYIGESATRTVDYMVEKYRQLHGEGA